MSTIDVASASEIEGRIYLRIGGRLVPLTDLTPISPTRQLIRSMLVEEYAALWRGIAEAQNDWFLQTASADSLQRRLQDFPIASLPTVQAAYGQIAVAVTADTDIVAGTTVATNPQDGSAPKSYKVQPNLQPDAAWADPTDGSGTWHITANSTRSINVVAVDVGTVGNTAANTITTGVANGAVTNPAPISNGIDAPSTSVLLDYFRSWLLSLKGSTRGAVLYAVTNFTDSTTGRRVHSAALQEWNGITELTGAGGKLLNAVLYIDEGLGAAQTGNPTADASLVSAVQRLLDGSDTQADPGVRDAGVPIEVRAAQALVIDVIASLDIATGYSPNAVIQQVTDAINAFFASVPVAGTTITGDLQGQIESALLFHAIVAVPGVLRVAIANPLADVSVPIGYKAVVGTLTVTGNLVS